MASIKLKKIKKPAAIGMDKPDIASNMYLPQFSADSKQIPELKDWEVGQTYKMVIEVKQKSKSETTVDDQVVTDARFEILSYDYLEPEDIAEMNDAEFGELQDQVLAGKKKLPK